MPYRIFEPKRKKVTGGYRKLQNEELHELNTCQQIQSDNKFKDNMDGAFGVCRRNVKCVQKFSLEI